MVLASDLRRCGRPPAQPHLSFALRVSSTAGGCSVPITFAAAALVFLLLDEIWAHQVITGRIVAGDAGNMRRVVRRIFHAMELLLVAACLGTAHALLNINWAGNRTLGAAIALAGGVVGVGSGRACRSTGAGGTAGPDGLTRSLIPRGDLPNRSPATLSA